MVVIPRHETFGVEFARSQVTQIEPTIGEVIKEGRTHPWYLEQITTTLDMLVAYALVEDPDSRDPRLSGQVALMAETGDAIFACAAAAEGDVVETVVGEPVTLWGTGPFEYAGPSDWLYAFAFAVVSRRADILDRLGAISPAGATDEYVVLWARALGSYWRSGGQQFLAGRVFDDIEKAMGATAADRVQITSSQQLELVERPLLSAFSKLVLADPGPDGRVDAGNAEAFNAALAETLEGHQKFWGAEARKHQPLQFVAWNALALACLATERGIEVTVRSDYLPPALLGPPVQSAAAYYRSIVDPDSADGDQPQPPQRLARAAMTAESLDALGVAVAPEAVSARYGGTVELLAGPQDGSDTFAGVWRVTDQSGSSRTVVAEGSGPDIQLREGPAGQQGTGPYLQATLDALDDQSVAEHARVALADGSLDYILVTPQLDESGTLVGTTTRDFTL